MNWYAYASGNPVMFIDPLGWAAQGEQIGNNVSIFSVDSSSGYLENGGVAQQILWKGIPEGSNGMILQAVRITAMRNGTTAVVAERTEAWVVRYGHVFSINNGFERASVGDAYIIRRYVDTYPDSVSWTGNVRLMPGLELDGIWTSSSALTDVSKGMLYQEGLLFELTDPGIHRKFVIVNNRTEGRWDIQTSTVTTVGDCP